MPHSPTKDQDAYLYDMLESAQHIRRYMHGVTYEQFWDDSEKRDAVALRLSLIGEAARHIDKSIPGIPMKDIRGMRNRIAHDYGQVNFKIVWDVTQDNIEPIIEALTSFLGKR
ncbi:MAG: DUF86 domain-containing protein [Opitutaceae bacterium]|jgi:uncharacterized protein with HEPN domain